MLIEKKIAEGDIISLKLVSGEELISKVKGFDNSSFTLNKPLVLTIGAVPGPNGTVQHGLQLVPFMFGFDEETNNLNISMSSIITYTKTRTEIKDAYIRETTGLEVPKSPSLVA